jgi:hypothetical protein
MLAHKQSLPCHWHCRLSDQCSDGAATRRRTGVALSLSSGVVLAARKCWRATNAATSAPLQPPRHGVLRTDSAACRVRGHAAADTAATASRTRLVILPQCPRGAPVSMRRHCTGPLRDPICCRALYSAACRLCTLVHRCGFCICCAAWRPGGSGLSSSTASTLLSGAVWPGLSRSGRRRAAVGSVSNAHDKRVQRAVHDAAVAHVQHGAARNRQQRWHLGDVDLLQRGSKAWNDKRCLEALRSAVQLASWDVCNNVHQPGCA